MKKRWKNRIKILIPIAGTYDAWGHLGAESWIDSEEVWADVQLQFKSKSTACVTVRAPFEYTDIIRIQWNDQTWKPTQKPMCFPDTQFVQFNIEPL